ncbi:MAG: DUF2815 family protein [Sporolactobacillus sp.]
MPNTNNYATRVVTGEVRFSYAHLLKPQASNFGGEPKFSAVLLIPKNDTNTKAALDAAVNAAVQKGKAEKWNNVIPPRLRTPIKDGDGVKESDGMPYGDECKGHWVLSVSSGEDYPPKIVGPDLQPIMNATEVYSGMFGRIAVNFAPYSNSGNKGVGAYISTNVMKTGDGEPLGASAPDAGSDFGAPGAPLNNGASVLNGIPDAGQAAQQPAYGQTAQPASPYPNYGQQPQGQRLNPLTGQPM